MHEALLVVGAILGVARFSLEWLKGREVQPDPEAYWVDAWKDWARERGLRMRHGDVVEGEVYGWPIRVEVRKVTAIVAAKLCVTSEEIHERALRLEYCKIREASIELRFAPRTMPAYVERILESLYHLSHTRRAAYR